MIGLFLAVACAGIETNLRCEDCFEDQVIRIIDGDTLDTSRGVIRLYGVDTPEVGQRCSTEATQRLRKLAGDRHQTTMYLLP